MGRLDSTVFQVYKRLWIELFLGSPLNMKTLITVLILNIGGQLLSSRSRPQR